MWATVAARAPQRAALAAAFVALNPLAVVLVALGGQNDAAMMFFVALGFLLLEGRLGPLAPMAFVAAVLIKPAAGLFLAIALIYMLSRAPRSETAAGWLLAGVVAVAAMAPFWEGTMTFDTVREQSRLFTTSPVAAAAEALDGALRRGTAERIASGTGLVLFATAAAWLAMHWLRRRGAEPAWAAASLEFAYLMAAESWFQAWYVMWLLVPVAIAGPAGAGRLFGATAIFSLTAMLVYVLTHFGRYLWWAESTEDLPVQVLSAIVVFVPPLIVVGAAHLPRRIRPAPGRRSIEATA